MKSSLAIPILVVAFTFTGISTIAVFARLYSRRFIIGSVKANDYVMLAALILTWGLCVINHFQVQFGTGSLNLMSSLFAAWYAYHIVYQINLAVVKFSILLLYRLIFPSKSLSIVINATMVFVACYSVTVTLLIAFECKHIADAWDVTHIVNRECLDYRPIIQASAALNFVTDILILAIPMPILAKLQLTKEKRIALIGLFSIGILAVAASITRIYFVQVWAKARKPEDISYYSAFLILWSQLEINMAIICASAVALKPLYKRIMNSASNGTISNIKYHLSYHRSGAMTEDRTSGSQPGGSQDLGAMEKEMGMELSTVNTVDPERQSGLESRSLSVTEVSTGKGETPSDGIMMSMTIETSSIREIGVAR